MPRFRLINGQDDVIFRFVARDAQQMQGHVLRRDNGNMVELPPQPSDDPSVKQWALPPQASLWLTLGEVLIRAGAPGEAGYERSLTQAGQLLNTQSKNPKLISGSPTGGIFIGDPERVELVGP